MRADEHTTITAEANCRDGWVTRDLAEVPVKSTLLAAAAALCVPAVFAQTAIAPGGSASFNVPGMVSLYQVFGHSGSVEGTALDAPYVTFATGARNVFTFTSVTGGVNCCDNTGDLATPDGGNWVDGFGSSIRGINGISDAVGNTQLPLVAMFGSDADPFGNAGPPALPAWDAIDPHSQAPHLYQVFYVGDGRAGFNDASGKLLTFTAPTDATRLYIGFVDALGFHDTSGFYFDNPGSIDATVTLTVPEPATCALMGLGLLSLALARRRSS
jgi:hypothetical protein